MPPEQIDSSYSPLFNVETSHPSGSRNGPRLRKAEFSVSEFELRFELRRSFLIRERQHQRVWHSRARGRSNVHRRERITHRRCLCGGLRLASHRHWAFINSLPERGLAFLPLCHV